MGAHTAPKQEPGCNAVCRPVTCTQRSRAQDTKQVAVANATVSKLSISELRKGAAGRHASLIEQMPCLGRLPAMLEQQLRPDGTSPWEAYELDDKVGGTGLALCACCSCSSRQLAILAGHMGSSRKIKRLLAVFFWPHRCACTANWRFLGTMVPQTPSGAMPALARSPAMRPGQPPPARLTSKC